MSGFENRVCTDPEHFPWRAGRKVGRTVYVLMGGEASDADELIGTMDSRAIAAAAIADHNARIGSWSRCCGFPMRREGDELLYVCEGCRDVCDAVLAARLDPSAARVEDPEERTER